MSELTLNIITACYNDSEELAKTISSIKKISISSNLKIIHIIVDGGSSDSTSTIVNESIDERYSPIFISEKDEGVYDAINKGIGLVNKGYILVINAGDILLDDFVVDDVMTYISENSLPYLIGKVKYVKNGVEHPESFCESNRFIECSHQAFIYDHSLHYSLGHYDLSYKSASDYHFFSKVNEVYGVTELSRINVIMTQRDKSGINMSDSVKHTLEMILIDIRTGLIRHTYIKRIKSLISKLIKAMFMGARG